MGNEAPGRLLEDYYLRTGRHSTGQVILITSRCGFPKDTQKVEVNLMETGILIGKLLDIERALGVEDTASLRSRVIEAQEFALQMQKQYVENLRVRSGFSIVGEHTSLKRSA